MNPLRRSMEATTGGFDSLATAEDVALPNVYETSSGFEHARAY